MFEVESLALSETEAQKQDRRRREKALRKERKALAVIRDKQELESLRQRNEYLEKKNIQMYGVEKEIVIG